MKQNHFKCCKINKNVLCFFLAKWKIEDLTLWYDFAILKEKPIEWQNSRKAYKKQTLIFIWSLVEFRILNDYTTIIFLWEELVKNLNNWFRLNDFKIIVKQSIFIEKVQPDRFLFLLLERGEIDLENVIDKLKKDNNFTVAKMRFYWEQMLEAVQECHASGIIHADIKPQNFVLVKGQLKLIDFGFALQIEPGKNSVERSLPGSHFKSLIKTLIQYPTRNQNLFMKYFYNLHRIGYWIK